jgi:hypothetical protein
MKMKALVFFTATTAAVLLSNCATIVGGSRYIAHVVVADRPNAKIVINGEQKGNGSATFPVMRKTADKLVITVKEEGCPEETFRYTSKIFRGWAFFGSIVGWTGVYSSTDGTWIPLPFGVIVDLATGAVWKPDVTEKGVTKEDYKNFRYTINYTGCPTKSEE